MDGSVAVLLPTGKLFDLVYSEAITPTATELKKNINRLDILFIEERVRVALIEGLKNAELVIADLTGKNPNVMYGVGVADALGKKVLFLVQHLDDFPFANEVPSVIVYAGDRQFLKGELAAYFKEERKSPESTVRDAGEKFHQLFGDILARRGYVHRGEVEMENATTFVLLNQDMDLALVQELARKARELGMRLKLM